MSSDYIRKLKIDRENNIMTAEIADMRCKPITYRKVELYKGIDNFDEKYGELIYALMTGLYHFSDNSHELVKLGNGEKTLYEIQNYSDDCRALGVLKAYQKYENKIAQILKEGIEGRKLEVIPSELELHYTMETLPNKTFKDVSKIFYTLETITENKNLTVKEKKSSYSELLNKLLDEKDKEKPIFTLYRNENPNVIVSVYPSLEANTYKDDVFLSYYFDIKNIQTNYEKIYAHNGMMISYLLDDEIRTKQALHGMEQQFIEDEKIEIDKLQEETEELGEQE